MDRRKLLLVAAAIIAALGAVLVFLYVRGADLRAEAQYDNRDVLKVVTTIDQGETIEDAAAAGKIALEAVPSNQVLPDALASTSTLTGQVAVTTIYPGEQIISSKFGGVAESAALPIKEGDIAISVSLSDTARVAGFVNPGSEVAIFLNGVDPANGSTYTRVLLDRVTVIGVGSTTPITMTTTTEEGAETVENLPRTILTLTLPQADAQRVMYAVGTGELTFALLNDDSEIGTNPGVQADNLFPQG